MLLFYGWTDTLLLNLANTKESFFPGEEADLVVLDLPRVSRQLVEAIRESGLFRKVVWLKRPAFHREKGPLTLLEKGIRLLSGQRYYRCYRGQLETACGGMAYRVLFTGAFWSETLFLYRYFSRQNPRLKISLVEEGTTNYSAPKGWQFRCMPTERFRERLMRCFYFPLTWARARRSVSEVYLYSLKINRSDSDVPAVRLPALGAETPACRNILRDTVQGISLEEYRRRKVYFIPGPLAPGYEDDYEETSRIIELILASLPKDSLLIKPHPQGLGEDHPLVRRFSQRAFVETRPFFLNGALAQLEMERKLFITRSSSLPLSLKTMFGQEPFVLFTYRLYSCYRANGEPVTDRYLEGLKKEYNTEKIACPASFRELQSQLKFWYRTGLFFSERADKSKGDS